MIRFGNIFKTGDNSKIERPIHEQYDQSKHAAISWTWSGIIVNFELAHLHSFLYWLTISLVFQKFVNCTLSSFISSFCCCGSSGEYNFNCICKQCWQADCLSFCDHKTGNFPSVIFERSSLTLSFDRLNALIFLAKLAPKMTKYSDWENFADVFQTTQSCWWSLSTGFSSTYVNIIC